MIKKFEKDIYSLITVFSNDPINTFNKIKKQISYIIFNLKKKTSFTYIYIYYTCFHVMVLPTILVLHIKILNLTYR